MSSDKIKFGQRGLTANADIVRDASLRVEEPAAVARAAHGVHDVHHDAEREGGGEAVGNLIEIRDL